MAGLTKDDIGTVRTIVKEEVKDIRQDLRRLGGLMEDMDSKFDTALEMLGSNLKVKSRVDDHDRRLMSVETSQDLLTKTVTAHSRKLNTQSDN